MLLVIFGAGASYDSAPRLPPPTTSSTGDDWRPPLANQLFEDRPNFGALLTRFPAVLPLAARLGRASDALPLEGMLAALRNEAAEYPARHSELAAVRYYLQGLIWECERFWLPQHRAVTNYLGLLDRIQRWRRGDASGVLFATFNYDRLFEYAASFYLSDRQHIYQNLFNTLSSYIEHPEFPLIKVHGSLDWGYRVRTPIPIVQESSGHVWQIAAEVIRRFPDLDISNEIERTDERPPQPQAGYAYVPALALPVDRKGDFACPEDHLAFLTQALPRVRSIITIGWRGMEPHFCEMLRTHLPSGVNVWSVSGNSPGAEQTMANLRAAGVGASWNSSPGGFSEFVVGGDVDSILEGALRN
jgi:hypothetical protein